ncbi:MAG TPA: hypothetical protein VLT82_22840 [Myxococcaceae bacterium]|nr:hypothetical protein [Myxococcaceae bacterium]
MHRTARLSVVMSMVIIGCGQGAGVSTAAYSDRQIFEGVIFGAGPVANLIPEARDHLRPELYARTTEQLNAMGNGRAATIDAIERSNPRFLAEFARAARSGDPASVERMVVQAVNVVSNTLRVSALATSKNLPVGDTSTSKNLPVGDTATSKNLPVGDALATSKNLPVGDTATSKNLPVGDTATSKNLPVALRTGLSPELVHPGLSAFSSRLFTEQLANSVAITFEQPGNGG